MRAELGFLVEHPSEVHEVIAGGENNEKSVNVVEVGHSIKTLKYRNIYVCKLGDYIGFSLSLTT